ncbi:MAG: cbb3-type cytochrome c oxidase subunit I [Chromatiales bacterium]|nr:cbb3-type cytochrome c oxidase subunit I [Chromatiales bacterium]
MSDETKPSGLALAHIWIAFLLFAVAALLGLYQVAERAELIPVWDLGYYSSVTSHGAIMGFVLTTLFISGFGYYTAATSLKMAVPMKGVAWLGWILMVGGSVMAAVFMLTGQAAVLFTFYPPLTAHVGFYIGAVLLVVGSWLWVLVMIVMMGQWKKANPGKPVPLAMFGTAINALLWFWTSIGVALEVLLQIIPLALGLVDTIDVGLARTLFSWTLHPIVYFWLLPAYITLYTIVPKAAGGRLISDEMARIAFIMLVVFGLPIGFHHLYMDPFQAEGWKILHMVGTMLVAIPTMITGFTVIGSLEIAGRLRGGKGLFGWISKVDWSQPVVLAGGLAMLMLTIGGFGGLVNASYSLNVVVHNTQWVTGHFHLIFGGTVVIMYMGAAYYIWPSVTGKELASPSRARTQLWLWFIGMNVLTLPWHYLGLLGQPRRTAFSPYGEQISGPWDTMELLMVVGGVILVISALLLILNLAIGGAAAASREVEYAEAVHPPVNLPNSLNGFTLWNWIIAISMVVAFGYPVAQFWMMPTYDPVMWGF